MNALEILVPGAALTIGTIVLGFVFNQLLVSLGNRFDFTVPRNVKVGVVYAVSVGLTGYYAVQAGWVLPSIDDPIAFTASLLTFALAVTKAAQPIYSRFGQGILRATD